MPSVLVIDDEEGIRRSLKQVLEDENYVVFQAPAGKEGIISFRENNPDIVLLDIKMPRMDGLKVLAVLKEEDSSCYVIMISGHGDIKTAVEATKLGAYDFLEKPLEQERVLITVRNALSERELYLENQALRSDKERKYRIIGESPKLLDVLKQIDKVAASDARVLIMGESGTGKELIARAIHRRSKRAHKRFVEVNCAAIPNELIESELFGHEKGAFTGAFTQKQGKFELADGGTLFLDEVGDMNLNAQAKVLRALEEGVIEHVGGNEMINVDVRVVAATNKNLTEEVKEEKFREDLYFRLNVVPVVVPALRERKSDIPILTDSFLEIFSVENGVKIKKIDEGGLKLMMEHSWHGNVRELKNTIERLAIFSAGNLITEKEVRDLMETEAATKADYAFDFDTFQEFKENVEQKFLQTKLAENKWNISETARKLQMQRSNLYKKITKYGLIREQ